jgi:hypothetical protein
MTATKRCIVVKDGNKTIAEIRYNNDSDLKERLNSLGWAFRENYDVMLKWGKVEENIDIAAFRCNQI